MSVEIEDIEYVPVGPTNIDFTFVPDYVIDATASPITISGTGESDLSVSVTPIPTGAVTYLWTVESGTGGLSDETTANATLSVSNMDAPQTIDLKVVVDIDGQVFEDTVSVTQTQVVYSQTLSASQNPTYGLTEIQLSSDISPASPLPTSRLWTIEAGVGELLQDDLALVTLKLNNSNAPQTLTIKSSVTVDGSLLEDTIDITHNLAGTNPDKPCDGRVLINTTIKCCCPEEGGGCC